MPNNMLAGLPGIREPKKGAFRATVRKRREEINAQLTSHKRINDIRDQIQHQDAENDTKKEKCNLM